MIKTLGMAACVMALAACASQEASNDPLDLMSGGRFKGAQLEKALAEAAKHKLDSEQNPVRADFPPGQRAYLSRLRCADGKAPAFQRAGSMGAGVFGSIVDAYDVTCAGSTPAKSVIIMDMYFPGYVEKQAFEGFTIAP